jgi:inner membrane protein
LTHALSGALLARATAPKDLPARSIPRRVAAGFFACAAPDLDFVVSYFGPVAYLELHRGPTHSLLLLPFWAFIFSWVLAKILREPEGKTAGWRALYGVTAMGLALHIAGDLITSYGTIIFWPLSDMRPGLGTTFIIDLWFSGIILLGLVASAFFYRSRIPAVAASIALCAYVGFQYLQKEKAIEFGRDYARSRGLQDADVRAHPRPVSPFNWTVFVSDPRQHHFAHVNLVRDTPRRFQPGDGFVAKLDAPYQPLAQARWETRSRYGENEVGKEAWQAPSLAFFRWFAERPAFDGSTRSPDCFWFADLRFLNPGRDGMPFRFGACREKPGSPWRAYERLDEGGVVPLDSR